MFSLLFKYLIIDSNTKFRYSIRIYIKENLYNKVFHITFLLLIGSILEYFVSAQIFSSLGIQ